jgi:DNA-binding LacI/PurR family transcriptional regulator
MAAASDPIAVLMNRNNPNAPDQVKDLEEAASRTGVQLLLTPIGTEADLDPAFATLAEKRVT